MDIKQIYREETDKDVYKVALMEQRVEHFSDEYVKWLENKLKNSVSQQRGILIQFTMENLFFQESKDNKALVEYRVDAYLNNL